MVTVGDAMSLLETIVSVTTSPGFANVVEALLEVIVTLGSVGTVLSMVTVAPEVMVLTVVVALPSAFPTTIENGTTPALSAPVITADAVHDFPPALTTVAVCVPIVPLGVMSEA